MSKAGIAKRLCALAFVALVLAGGGFLAWKNLAPDKDDKEPSGGLFSFFDDNKNATEVSPAPTTRAPVPTVSPSSAPTIYRYPFHQCSPNAAACCNGLENLCDWPVNAILFGGVHNAMATTDKFIVPNQLRPMNEALEAGYRAISLDVCRCQGAWKLCHGLCGLGKVDAKTLLTQMADFLKENENEVLILTLELNSEAGEPVDLNEFHADVMATIDGLNDMLYFHEDAKEPWPTLGTLIENDERLIAFHFNGPNCTQPDECPRGMHWYFEHAQETGFDFDSIQDILDSDNSCLISRGATTTTGAFFGVNNFITSKMLDAESQAVAAETTNFLDFVNQRIQKCTEVFKTQPYHGEGDVNLFFIDYWNIGDVVEVVQEYNRNLGEFTG